MAFGAIIIGDEILVGKRQDKHLSFAIEALAKRGLRLAWAEYHGDDPERLTAALKRSFERADIVFSFGGIGATPDDHTRQCAAAALALPLALHPDAEREIRARFGTGITPQRLRMGDFPAGCEIIPNPFNRIPGFSIRDHHFVPGFPQMAWPMIEWVLDTRYRALFDRDRWAEASIFVYEAGESQLIPAMESVERGFDMLKAFSLPSMGPNATRRHVELGVRGDPAQVEAAIAQMRAEVRALGFPFEDAARR
ncbi:MAG: competence/damage-inducible protein A [Burkholderiales bacterium]|nr:competence/damage-inducible protein A [Burkholderiales bacterium]